MKSLTVRESFKLHLQEPWPGQKRSCAASGMTMYHEVLIVALIKLWMGVEVAARWLDVLWAGDDVIQPPNVRFTYDSTFHIQRCHDVLFKRQTGALCSSLALPIFFCTILVCFTSFISFLAVDKQWKRCTTATMWSGTIVYVQPSLSGDRLGSSNLQVNDVIDFLWI